MEILKQGKNTPLGETKKFECPNCGCVFKVHKRECGYTELDSPPVYYKHTCPNCTYIVYLKIEE